MTMILWMNFRKGSTVQILFASDINLVVSFKIHVHRMQYVTSLEIVTLQT